MSWVLCWSEALSYPLVPLNGILGHALTSNVVEQFLLDDCPCSFETRATTCLSVDMLWRVKDGRDKKVMLYEWCYDRVTRARAKSMRHARNGMHGKSI